MNTRLLLNKGSWLWLTELKSHRSALCCLLAGRHLWVDLWLSRLVVYIHYLMPRHTMGRHALGKIYNRNGETIEEFPMTGSPLPWHASACLGNGQWMSPPSSWNSAAQSLTLICATEQSNNFRHLNFTPSHFPWCYKYRNEFIATYFPFRHPQGLIWLAEVYF